MVKQFTYAHPCGGVIGFHMSQHEIFHRTEEVFPDVLREIALYVGHDAAMKLVKSYGGTSIYIPSVASRISQGIEEAIGREAASSLCNGFGGSDLYIPRCLKGLLLSRNISVCLDYEDLITSMGSDAATNVLARRYALSNRYIYMILKGTDPAAVTAERKRRRVVGLGERQKSASRVRSLENHEGEVNES